MASRTIREAAPSGRVVGVVLPTFLTASVASGSALALVLTGSVTIGGLGAPLGGPGGGGTTGALPRVRVPGGGLGPGDARDPGRHEGPRAGPDGEQRRRGRRDRRPRGLRSAARAAAACLAAACTADHRARAATPGGTVPAGRGPGAGPGQHGRRCRRGRGRAPRAGGRRGPRRRGPRRRGPPRRGPPRQRRGHAPGRHPEGLRCRAPRRPAPGHLPLPRAGARPTAPRRRPRGRTR